MRCFLLLRLVNPEKGERRKECGVGIRHDNYATTVLKKKEERIAHDGESREKMKTREGGLDERCPL